MMIAAVSGAGREFCLAFTIRLPFEPTAASTLVDDDHLVRFRYFFTRKLTFMKESSAFALLPGGFGTMDEAFELLTLMQTGRSPVAPVVLLEPEGSTYWMAWQRFVEEELESRGLISASDFALTRICTTIEAAVEEICRFYSSFHSYRFVGRRTVLRLTREVGDDELAVLNRDFADIVVSGEIERVPASQPEVDDGDVVDLPRLSLAFDKMSYARLRLLIDQINR
jgi:predicted Rossmann-fold nucleotide-binding protein